MISIGKIKIKAIALGFLVDTAGSFFLGIILGIILTINQVKQEIYSQDIYYLILSLIIGFGFTCLGGYVAGRISKDSQVLHGGVVGGLGLIWGVILYYFFPSPIPIWFHVISYTGLVPVGMLGGDLASKQLRTLKEK